MNQHLKTIQDLLQQNKNLSDADKEALIKSINDADKQWGITEFKLDKTEKVKKATAILLEETIEELEQKRKAVEAQNRELEIESSLERVRTVAMSMSKSDDLLNICKILFKELQSLGFTELRNTLIHTFVDEKKYFVDYDFSDFTGGCISHIPYSGHPVIEKFIERMRNSNEAFAELAIKGKELKDWKLFRKANGEVDDPRLDTIKALYYYIYSVGTGGIGISTFSAISEEKLQLLKRFRNVFDFAYKRYADVAQAEAQVQEAKIEASLERIRSAAMSMRKSEELIVVCESMYNELVALGFSSIRNAQISIKDVIKQSYFVTEYSDHIRLAMPEAPYEGSPIIKEIYDEMERSKDAFYQKEITGKIFEDWRAWRMDMNAKTDSRIAQATSMWFYLYSIGAGYLGISTFNKITDDQVGILKRFKNVFELSYQRYKDVANAEAQAREAQIEAALEKVRSRSLAMHRSDELQQVVNVVFGKLMDLGIMIDSASIIVLSDIKEMMEYWIAVPGQEYSSHFRIPYFDDTAISRDFIAARTNGTNFNKCYTGKDKNEQWSYLFEHSDLKHIPDDRKKFLMGTAAYTVSVTFTKNTALQLLRYQEELFSERDNEVFQRFANVFEQAYIRFLDLKKAEAQAKDAKIEASLERIRAKAMAMHHSDELDEVLAVLFDQFDVLGISPMSTHMTLIDLTTNTFTFRETGKGGRRSFGEQVVAIDSMDIWKQQAEKWRNSEPFSINKIHFPKEALPMVWQIFHESFAAMPDDAKIVPEDYPDGIYHTAGNCKFGYIGMNQTRQATEEEEQIVLKFSTEFGRFYQRFLDLKKAEAQTREATIETSLERVRAHAMAMHNSADLSSTVNIFFKELKTLGIIPMRCGVGEMQEETHTSDLVFTTADKQGELYELPGKLKHEGHPVVENIYNYWKLQEEYHPVLQGSDINAYYRVIKSQMTLPDFPDHSIHYGNYFYFKEGFFFAWAEKEFTEEAMNIFRRFTSVFSLTYKRYKDLKLAEAQAREAKIETALERVRSKTMAMHNSADVGETVATMFDELTKLGVETIRCGIGIMHNTQLMELWTAKPDEKGKVDMVIGWIDMNLHPLLQGAYANWSDKKETYSYELKDDDLVNYFTAINSFAGYPVKYDIATLPRQIFHNEFHFAEGTLFAFSLQQLPEESRKIFKRFAGVFGQTYRRYLDLQKAEANATEAKIETALERVRSRTLAMQKSDELAETAVVLFSQLIGLGIEPNRLYIGIIKGENGDMEMWATDEDGTEVITKLIFNKNANASVKKLYDGWVAKRKSLVVDMQGKELEDYFHYLKNVMNVPFKGGPTQKRRVQHVAYFSKGFIGMASPDEQSEESIQLLERFAAVFNLTFTRFNDLKIAEAHAEQAEIDLIKLQTEKKRAEDALTELRSTQTQLIQAEKMASLGELTAGIAHEIQNPLNFVNNFSEVSNELLDELMEEVTKGNYEEVKAILDDVKQNLEKINHHGKRADGIVKGMLQHSRSSSGQMEPTDINVLADEYLRLAYHGLRAKDKSFNATLKTDYDPALPNVNVIPQDMGRVILNLITNAFYVVDERKKQKGKSFEPTVTVTTKRIDSPLGDGGIIVVQVTDNGNGIPHHIIDKIFQPFFTTKPTGQGTGLGLSLAYDIVKAHGGELKVETKVDEGNPDDFGKGTGTTFIIQLPAINA